MKILLSALLCPAFLRVCALAGKPGLPGYRVAKKIPLPGDGGWDFLLCDSAARRVYLTHGDRVQVIDASAPQR